MGGHFSRPGSDKDAVKRRKTGQTLIAISEETADTAVAKFGQQYLCTMKQCLYPLNGVHFGSHFRKHTSLVSGTRTDLEDFVFWFYTQELRLKCNRIGLRDRLFAADRKGHIAIGPFFKSAVQKTMTWDRFHGLQYALVADAFTAQRLNELATQSFVPVCILFQWRQYRKNPYFGRERKINKTEQMTQIKFGTDGWRAIIADDYTVENVRRVAEGTAKWMQQQGMRQVVIGYDCRFGGKLFAETSARVFGAFGIKVLMGHKFVSTPMVSLGVVRTASDLGVVITASHNPPSYNGFKLKSSYGGPTVPSDITAVENLVPAHAITDTPSLAGMRSNGLYEEVDLEQMYFYHVVTSFDLDTIKSSGLKIAYDAMYGAGQDVLPRILPDAVLLHCDYNPSFKGQAPEPILRNLGALASLMQSGSDLALGLANDGDADRIGLFDAEGNFIDSHHILLLLLYYMYHYKKMDGKVVITFSVTDKMLRMAEKYGLATEVTQIGFKYIAEIMTREDILVGGEESGGLAVKGHIPERDGIWIGLVILEFMARTGKSLRELIDMVYAEVGPFVCDRDDLHITESQKAAVIAGCKGGRWSAFGSYQVKGSESLDGFKYILSEDAWVMIRPSGTEPVLRVYVQAPDSAEARRILDATRNTILE